jgi:NAD(P)-dependent dehydrogenase (short-subunit alcohol dehydrogenase family)
VAPAEPGVTGPDLDGAVALVTGGASGIGAAVARRLAGRGATVVVVDVDGDGAREVAGEVGGQAMRLDVSDAEALGAAVAETERLHGRLDVVHLNAGCGGGQGGLEDLDLAGYRKVVGVNVDHVVYGTCAAVPALRRSGGGLIVATASLAGLIEMPFDPLYTMTKHAVVGYVRAAGAALAAQGAGIRLCALCPGFADTPLIAAKRDAFAGFPLLTADDVADAFEAVLAGGEPGQAWVVQPGRPAEPYRFRGVPGPAGSVRPPDIAVTPS